MRSIGVRELRQNASQHLREVALHRETIEITDRGRPVARLVPIPSGSAVERMVAEGRATPPTADLSNRADPLAPTKGVPLPSETLAEMRRDER